MCCTPGARGSSEGERDIVLGAWVKRWDIHDDGSGRGGPGCLIYNVCLVCDLRPTYGRFPKSWEGGVELGVWVTRDLHSTGTRLHIAAARSGIRCMSGHALYLRDGRSSEVPVLVLQADKQQQERSRGYTSDQWQPRRCDKENAGLHDNTAS